MSKVEFTLKHYAGPVTYTTIAFVDKNKDTLSDDLTDLIKASNSVLLQGLFVPKETPETPKKAAGPGKRRTNNETVTSKFKSQVPFLTACFPSLRACTSQPKKAGKLRAEYGQNLLRPFCLTPATQPHSTTLNHTQPHSTTLNHS